MAGGYRPLALGGLTPIADQTLAVAGTFNFTGIPQTFKHLLLVVTGRSTQAAANSTVFVNFNGDVGLDYDEQNLRGVSGTPAATVTTSAGQASLLTVPGSTSTRPLTAGMNVAFIGDYTSTTFEKAMIAIGGDMSGQLAGVETSTLRNTAAITSIQISAAGVNFQAGSRATLYGI